MGLYKHTTDLVFHKRSRNETMEEAINLLLK